MGLQAISGQTTVDQNSLTLYMNTIKATAVVKCELRKTMNLLGERKKAV